ESNWVLDEAQLTDQAIIRRMVLKRCIYGVDKNRLTVELAKVSLWLHSFTVGAPLSFLDHHLRCGDSLVGLRVRDATDELNRLGGMFASSAIASAETATDGMQLIEEMSDADVAEVQESAALFDGVEETTADLRGLLDFLCGWRWLTAGMKRDERAEFEEPLVRTLGYYAANAYELLARGPEEDISDFAKLWHEATSIANREDFLHWEVAFPGVWHRWQESRPQGGFDAVIGNPPWDRIKLQEVEWFATRDRDLALAPTAAARRKGIQQLRDQGASLATEFDAAKAQAESLSQVVRSGGDYPLLSGGDINLYSLFVERSMSLIKPDGFVGLLTPSGIYADKTAARFFQSVSTSGRVGGLFDFENKKIFFKDVHASFKFCALILGGEERRFDQAECAFFLHDTKTVHDEDRCFPLTPEDFARVNPNTGTAPVFRSRKDAEITRRIYKQHPVLVKHLQSRKKRAWRVKYATMFHMANDSHFFRTSEQLEAEGFYPVEGNRWKRGEELYLPLYQGRMIRQFDHRANSVKYNPDNTINPYLSVAVSDAEHANPAFSPMTQYWVLEQEVSNNMPDRLGWTIAYRRIARPTDARTMIVAAVPKIGLSDSVFLLMPEKNFSAADACLLIANLNSYCFDYVTRHKMPGTNLSWFIVEQLPVIASTDYDRSFGAMTARDLVRDHVLRLTYTAHDMAPFARDLGYDGEPFI
ncbi:MAG: restriction endonuclease, partial [Gemmatimonadota bacterium]|nr:restriction endonuclease [Gemmatimonadota bacterium]